MSQKKNVVWQTLATIGDAIAVIWDALVTDARSYAGCCVGSPDTRLSRQAPAQCCR